MTRELDVYLHEQKVGSLAQDDGGALSFAYAAEYLTASHNRAISVSMPLREEPIPDRIAKPFFSGLLPDDRARQRLASALGVSEGNTFGLLEIIGGECAGALMLLPSGMDLPDLSSKRPEPLSERGLIEILELLRTKPLLGGEEGIRLSLAGAQDKLAVCLIEGRVALAQNGGPTTHILKPFIEGLKGTAENEFFCMKLARRVGLPAPKVSKAAAGTTDYILVERYDRIIKNDNQIVRLHQEDFCQALSVPPELKYEEEGGPGIAQSQELIQNHTGQPAADRLAFLRMVMFHYLVGNADAHAKNYALLYRSKTPDLAPLYDIVCTAAYPNLSKKLALAIGGRSIADTINLDQWLTLVPDTKAAQRLLVKDLREMANRTQSNADELLKELKEQGTAHSVLGKIRRIIETRATHLLQIT